MNRPKQRKRDCSVRKTRVGATHKPNPGKVRQKSKFKTRMIAREMIKCVRRVVAIAERREAHGA